MTRSAHATSACGEPVDLGPALRLFLRPLRCDDRPALVRVLEQLSAESRLNRFFAPIGTYSEPLLKHLTDLDGRDRLALLGLAEEGARATPIAVARYSRSERRADEAELAVAVADRFQRRHVASVLLRALAAAARGNGIERFVGHLRPENLAVRGLLAALGADLARAGDGLLRFEVPAAAVARLRPLPRRRPTSPLPASA